MDRYLGIDVRAASRMIAVVHARGKQVGSRVVTCASPKRDPRSVTCVSDGVLRGHYAYYGVPTNYYALDAFRSSVVRNWYRSLQRRSQRSGLDWNRMSRVVARWLPSANIVHPWPNDRFRVTTQGKSPVR